MWRCTASSWNKDQDQADCREEQIIRPRRQPCRPVFSGKVNNKLPGSSGRVRERYRQDRLEHIRSAFFRQRKRFIKVVSYRFTYLPVDGLLYSAHMSA
jgi:hypothetical protein